MIDLFANKYTLGAASFAMLYAWIEETALFSPLYHVADILARVAAGQ